MVVVLAEPVAQESLIKAVVEVVLVVTQALAVLAVLVVDRLLLVLRGQGAVEVVVPVVITLQPR